MALVLMETGEAVEFGGWLAQVVEQPAEVFLLALADGNLVVDKGEDEVLDGRAVFAAVEFGFETADGAGADNVVRPA